jgi:hypothetical protein
LKQISFSPLINITSSMWLDCIFQQILHNGGEKLETNVILAHNKYFKIFFNKTKKTKSLCRNYSCIMILFFPFKLGAYFCDYGVFKFEAFPNVIKLLLININN